MGEAQLTWALLARAGVLLLRIGAHSVGNRTSPSPSPSSELPTDAPGNGSVLSSYPMLSKAEVEERHTLLQKCLHKATAILKGETAVLSYG